MAVPAVRPRSRLQTASATFTSRSPSTSQPERACSGWWNRKPAWSTSTGLLSRSKFWELRTTLMVAMCSPGFSAPFGESFPPIADRDEPGIRSTLLISPASVGNPTSIIQIHCLNLPATPLAKHPDHPRSS